MIKISVLISNITDISRIAKCNANGVVVQTSFFSMPNNKCISEEKIGLFKDECDKYNIDLYVKMNRLFFDEDLARVKAQLKYLKQLKVKGIYFSDEALLWISKVEKMEDMLLYDPDTLITNCEDVKFYLDQKISKVVLGHELTIEEILYISDRYGDKVEILGHGRRMIMQTRRRLLTNYMDFFKRDETLLAKQGLYIKEEKRDDHMPIYESEFGTYVLSGKCLHSFNVIRQLNEHAISSMRIEVDDINEAEDTLKLYWEILNSNEDLSNDINAFIRKYEKCHLSDEYYYLKSSKKKEKK